MHDGSFHRGGDPGHGWVQQAPLQGGQQQALQGAQPGYHQGGYQQVQQTYQGGAPVMLRTYMPGHPSSGALHADHRGLPMQVHAVQQPVESMYASQEMVDVFGSRTNTGAPHLNAPGFGRMSNTPSSQAPPMMLAMHPGNEMYYVSQPMNMMQSAMPMMANSQPDHMGMARMSAQGRNTMSTPQHLSGSHMMHAGSSGLMQPGFMPAQMHPGGQHKMQQFHPLQQRPLGLPTSQIGQQQAPLQLQQADAGKKRVQRGMEENVKRTIYVSYIDVMVSEEQLANFFSACGPVVDCRICADPNSAMRFAFLEFSDVLSAQKALSMSGTILGGWPLRVQPSKTAIVPVSKDLMPRSQDELVRCSRTVYVASIDKRVEKADLSAFFEQLCGPVAKLRLLGDATHNTRIAFVEFVSAEGALAALNCSGALLGSLPVRVSPSKTPIRSDTRAHRSANSKHRDRDRPRDRDRVQGPLSSSGAPALSGEASQGLTDDAAAAAAAQHTLDMSGGGLQPGEPELWPDAAQDGWAEEALDHPAPSGPEPTAPVTDDSAACLSVDVTAAASADVDGGVAAGTEAQPSPAALQTSPDGRGSDGGSGWLPLPPSAASLAEPDDVQEAAAPAADLQNLMAAVRLDSDGKEETSSGEEPVQSSSGEDPTGTSSGGELTQGSISAAAAREEAVEGAGAVQMTGGIGS